MFGNDQEQVTRDAADKLAVCFNKLLVRRVPRAQAQRFILQMLVALFAEDIELLPRYFVARLLDDCQEPADVIIGNPPFLGAKRLKPERGADYVNAVRKTYPAVPGMADYCVYWLRKTHDHLPACTRDDPVAGRAGLVGTQNIRNNKSREGGLDHIVRSGTIVEAVDNQPWSGEANVHVSIVNWVKHGPLPDGRGSAKPLPDGRGSDRESRGSERTSDLLKQLLDLNLDVAGRIERGQPVTAPGAPPSYPDPSALVTGDCIEPPMI